MRILKLGVPQVLCKVEFAGIFGDESFSEEDHDEHNSELEDGLSNDVLHQGPRDNVLVSRMRVAV